MTNSLVEPTTFVRSLPVNESMMRLNLIELWSVVDGVRSL
jgi:hypothetical protein